MSKQPYDWKADTLSPFAIPLAPATEGPIINKPHPFYHFCRKCINLVKVVAVAFIVEVAMFYPTHLLFHELGWL